MLNNHKIPVFFPNRSKNENKPPKSQNYIDHNQTYVFGSLPQSILEQKSERPFVSLHRQLNQNLTTLNDLRKKSEDKVQELSQVTQFLIKLNSLYLENSKNIKNAENETNESLNSSMIYNMLLEHNKILKEETNFIETQPEFSAKSQSIKKFNQKIKLLEKEIEVEKSSLHGSHSIDITFFNEREKIKAKIQLLKRQYDELSEFIQQEIEYEKQEDNENIETLNETILNLSNELTKEKDSIAQAKTSIEFDKIIEQIQQAKIDFQKHDEEIIKLRSENEILKASIEIEKALCDNLEKEKNMYQQLLVLGKK